MLIIPQITRPQITRPQNAYFEGIFKLFLAILGLFRAISGHLASILGFFQFFWPISGHFERTSRLFRAISGHFGLFSGILGFFQVFMVAVPPSALTSSSLCCVGKMPNLSCSSRSVCRCWRSARTTPSQSLSSCSPPPSAPFPPALISSSLC